MYEEPELIHRFFAKLLEAFCRLIDWRDGISGRRTESIGLADDHSAFVSNAMYREMVFPYNMAIYERYGKKGRHLHADGPNDHHFEMYANDMKLTSMDIGGFSDIANAKPALQGKTRFSGGLNCRDLSHQRMLVRNMNNRILAEHDIEGPRRKWQGAWHDFHQSDLRGKPRPYGPLARMSQNRILDVDTSRI